MRPFDADLIAIPEEKVDSEGSEILLTTKRSKSKSYLFIGGILLIVLLGALWVAFGDSLFSRKGDFNEKAQGVDSLLTTYQFDLAIAEALQLKTSKAVPAYFADSLINVIKGRQDSLDGKIGFLPLANYDSAVIQNLWLSLYLERN